MHNRARLASSREVSRTYRNSLFNVCPVAEHRSFGDVHIRVVNSSNLRNFALIVKRTISIQVCHMAPFDFCARTYYLLVVVCSIHYLMNWGSLEIPAFTLLLHR